jgi:hypothetical protein
LSKMYRKPSRLGQEKCVDSSARSVSDGVSGRRGLLNPETLRRKARCIFCLRTFALTGLKRKSH